MGHIFLKTSVLAFTGYAIYRVVTNAAPTVEIDRQAFAAPHPERGVAFAGLNPVMHQVQLWESSDGTTLDTLRATIDIDASMNNELQVIFFDIVIDRGNPGLSLGDTGDPVNGTDVYLDARMKDRSYQVSQRGFGFLRPEDEYTDESDPAISSGQGGFKLTGRTFDPADTYHITIYYATTSDVSTSTNELDVIIVSTDIVLDSTHYGKLIVGDAGGDTQTFTFPPFSGIPDKTRMSFSSQYGTYKYLKLECDTGDSIKFNDGDKIALFLSRDERIDLIWKGGVCYVINYEGKAKQRGELFGGFGIRTGYMLADGTEYTKSELSGFWDWLINDAPSVIKTTYTLWNASTAIGAETVYTHKGLFAVDLVGETFKVPDVSGMYERYLLSGDTTRTPNTALGYQHSAVEEHYHYSGHEPTSSLSLFLKGVIHTIKKAAGAGAGNIDTTAKASTGVVINRTDDPTDGIDKDETRVKSIAKVGLITL